MKKSNSEIIQNTIDIIRKKMKERQLTHKDVSELCSKNGEPVAPKTVGNMLNNPTSTTMSTLLKVCNALELNLSAILHSIESGLNSDNTKLFYDISNPAYSGYTGEYHVFFLSTIPNTDAHMEKPLIHGTLKLGDLHSVHELSLIHICAGSIFINSIDSTCKILTGRTVFFLDYNSSKFYPFYRKINIFFIIHTFTKHKCQILSGTSCCRCV